MADNSSKPYSVAIPKPLLEQLQIWSVQAKELGLGHEFLLALREINARLETDPKSWGDRLREYPVIRALELRGMIPKWLLVWYGVLEPARQVIVRALLPAPGSPLLSPH